jgi:hypothetical protein
MEMDLPCIPKAQTAKAATMRNREMSFMRAPSVGERVRKQSEKCV